jgi:hypothetical protein
MSDYRCEQTSGIQECKRNKWMYLLRLRTTHVQSVITGMVLFSNPGIPFLHVRIVYNMYNYALHFSKISLIGSSWIAKCYDLHCVLFIDHYGGRARCCYDVHCLFIDHYGGRSEEWSDCPLTGSPVDPIQSQSVLRVARIVKNARGRKERCSCQRRLSGKS